MYESHKKRVFFAIDQKSCGRQTLKMFAQFILQYFIPNITVWAVVNYRLAL